MSVKNKDKVDFRSDRFYLNHVPYEIFSNTTTSPAEERDDIRQCFDRKRYLEQVMEDEEVQCVVLSSYRIDWDVIQAQFQPCFKSSDRLNPIPLLVLHGDKSDDVREGKIFSKKANFTRKPSMEDEEDDEDDDHLEQRLIREERSKWEEGMRKLQTSNIDIWEVRPQWLMDSLPSNHPKRHLPGVHHPKYMLIFTQQGLHVNISTANLTVNGSIDGTWVQFFPKLPNGAQDIEAKDFGVVLENFIHMQSLQLRLSEDEIQRGNKRDVLKWIESRTNVGNLITNYDFSKASVDLVSTVPCRKPLPHLSPEEKSYLYKLYEFDEDLITPEACETCIMESDKLKLGMAYNCMEYGAKRMKSLLEQQLDEYDKMSQKDILYLQPTSIGIGLDNSYMGGLLEHYLPEPIWDEDLEVLRSERWRLIWPSREAMIDIYRYSKNNTPQKQIDDPDATEDENELADLHDQPILQGILFFHPKHFGLMETDIQTQFYTYEPTTAHKLKHICKKYTPHIKSYCRLVNEDHVRANKHHTDKDRCTCYDVAWTLITSACLSKGAQGVQMPYTVCSTCRHVRQGYVEYRNFELGLLFKSTNDLQYKALYGKCPVHGGGSAGMKSDTASNQIVLPFPYDLYHHSQPFCNEIGKVQIDLYYNPPATEGAKYIHAYQADSVVLQRSSASSNYSLDKTQSVEIKESNTSLGRRRTYSSFSTQEHSSTKVLQSHDPVRSSSVTRLQKLKQPHHDKKEQDFMHFQLETYNLMKSHSEHVDKKIAVSDVAGTTTNNNGRVNGRKVVTISSPKKDAIILDYQEWSSTEVEDNDENDHSNESQDNITDFLC